MGVDRNGNKYFENLEYPFGQHRWIEYKEIHNMEPTSIPPEWHGWMHHQTDELPKVRAHAFLANPGHEHESDGYPITRSAPCWGEGLHASWDGEAAGVRRGGE
jgi:NADH:ubiquinone oxidoreductase subunit